MRLVPAAELTSGAQALWRGLAEFALSLKRDIEAEDSDQDLEEIEAQLHQVWPMADLVRCSHPLLVPHYLADVVRGFAEQYLPAHTLPQFLLVYEPYSRNWSVAMNIAERIAQEIEASATVTRDRETAILASDLRGLVVLGCPAGEEEDGLLQVALLHELGHLVPRRNPKLAEALPSDLALEVTDQGLGRAARWTLEFIADVIAVHMAGPAYLWFVSYAVPNQPPSDTHPSTQSRIYACCRAMERFGWTDEARAPTEILEEIRKCREHAKAPLGFASAIEGICDGVAKAFGGGCTPARVFGDGRPAIHNWPALQRLLTHTPPLCGEAKTLTDVAANAWIAGWLVLLHKPYQDKFLAPFGGGDEYSSSVVGTRRLGCLVAKALEVAQECTASGQRAS